MKPRRALDHPLAVGVLLVAASFQPTASLLDANFGQNPAAFRLVVLSVATFVVAAVAVLTASRRGPLGEAGVIGSVVVWGFFAWGSIRRIGRTTGAPPHPAGGILATLVVVLVLWFVIRNRRSARLRSFVFVVLVVTTLAPTASLAGRSLSVEPATLETARPFRGTAAAAPDVYLVVLDAYGRRDVLARDYGFDNGPFVRALAAAGIVEVPDASANYPLTTFSVSSALAMTYVIPPGTKPGDAERLAVYRIMGGDNPVVRSLRAAGYEYVHVESGWAGSRCGANVDRCVHAQFVDETVWAMVRRTPLEPLMIRRMGHAWTAAGLDRIERVKELGREPRAGRRPRFVFAHILLPHPPSFLDASCRRRVAVELDSLTVGAVRDPALAALRRTAFIDQLRCTNRLILGMVRSLPRDAVVVLMGDHGPDSREQLVTLLRGWNREAITERLSILTAYRFPARCSGSHPRSPVNLTRVMLSCVLSVPAERVPDRHFIARLDPRDPLLEVRL